MFCAIWIDFITRLKHFGSFCTICRFRFGNHGLNTIILTPAALFGAILTEQTLIISTPLKITLTTRNGQPSSDMELELALSQQNSTRLHRHSHSSHHVSSSNTTRCNWQNGNIPQIQTGLCRCTHDDARPLPQKSPSTSEHSRSCKTLKKPWH
ncbi:hypothetical protein TNCV_3829381 [Trichonephila clavipes]|nr:hypothetical protein TNCV_3829381 [Trichonephila clavipes]